MADPLITYKIASDALSAGADALVKLTDAIKHIVSTGHTGYKSVTAKRTHKRLKDLSARAQHLLISLQTPIVESIDNYLIKPDDERWEETKQSINNALGELGALLEDIKKERSDFILDKSYSDFYKSSQSRVGPMRRLIGMSPPRSLTERKALIEINNKYKGLLKDFNEAIKQMNLYIKQLPDK